MKKITLAFVAVLFAVGAFAQDYKNSIGIRLGSGHYDGVGVAFKTYISQPGALEFDVGFIPDSYGGNDLTSVSLSRAYQHHFPIANILGFNWFIGGGAVLAKTFSDWDGYDGCSAGIHPPCGVDYKLKNAPLAFSADARPTIHVVKGSYHPRGLY